jgi:endogenous inhibitor of DNA gyrase (YacG/DUF329 family)
MSKQCPVCKKLFQLEDSESPPFCSKRCREIDMGRWLDERYTLPVEPSEDDEEPMSQDGANEDSDF